MPITVCIEDASATEQDSILVFDYFRQVDSRFSTYKKDSEISRFNRHEIAKKDVSLEMQEVLRLSDKTKKETDGYFNIRKADGTLDPSGLVKGWAIYQATKIIEQRGFHNFYIDAGGDIQTKGLTQLGKKWRVGIKNPFHPTEIVKIVLLSGQGIATSGTYIRGQHVYNPHKKGVLEEIVSISVIGPNVYDADRFATAAFAMQEKGITFIQSLLGFEGYMIDKNGTATMTSGFDSYVA